MYQYASMLVSSTDSDSAVSASRERDGGVSVDVRPSDNRCTCFALHLSRKHAERLHAELEKALEPKQL